MNPKYGPEVLPPAAVTRKRVEEHLDSLPAWGRGEPRDQAAEPDAEPQQRRRAHTGSVGRRSP